MIFTVNFVQELSSTSSYIRKYGYDFINTVNFEFCDPFQFLLSSYGLFMLNTRVFFTYLDVQYDLSMNFLQVGSAWLSKLYKFRYCYYIFTWKK